MFAGQFEQNKFKNNSIDLNELLLLYFIYMKVQLKLYRSPNFNARLEVNNNFRNTFELLAAFSLH